MDLLNMTNWAQILELYKKVKWGYFYLSSQSCVSHNKIQNYSSISQKLCLLCQKYTGILFVKNNIVKLLEICRDFH